MVKLEITVQRRDSELSICVIFCVKNHLNTISTHHIYRAVILVFFFAYSIAFCSQAESHACLPPTCFHMIPF